MSTDNSKPARKFAVHYKSLNYFGEQVIHVCAADENDAVRICREDGVGHSGGTVYPTTILGVKEVPDAD